MRLYEDQAYQICQQNYSTPFILHFTVDTEVNLKQHMFGFIPFYFDFAFTLFRILCISFCYLPDLAQYKQNAKQYQFNREEIQWKYITLFNLKQHSVLLIRYIIINTIRNSMQKK